jgi:hypothetical protein
MATLTDFSDFRDQGLWQKHLLRITEQRFALEALERRSVLDGGSLPWEVEAKRSESLGRLRRLWRQHLIYFELRSKDQGQRVSDIRALARKVQSQISETSKTPTTSAPNYEVKVCTNVGVKSSGVRG